MSDDFDPLRALRPDRVRPDDPAEPTVFAREKERLMSTIGDTTQEPSSDLRMPDIYPRLAYEDERAAVDYLVRVFQLAEIREARTDMGDTLLAWLRVGDGVVMIGHANAEIHRIHSPHSLGNTTVQMMVNVHDVDAHSRTRSPRAPTSRCRCRTPSTASAGTRPRISKVIGGTSPSGSPTSRHAAAPSLTIPRAAGRERAGTPITFVSVTDPQDLPAGSFSAWARRTRRAQMSDVDAEVPCGGCTACCRSSYFVHIAPDETNTLRRVPRELLFPAPGLPEGHVVLGYDDDGHCPMLVEGGCSIYEDRPRTCRTFDCRVFPAAGLTPDDEGKTSLAAQVRRWKFSFPSERDAVQHAAVQAAAAFLHAHPECFPDGSVPNTTRVSIVALEVHEAFLRTSDASGAVEVTTPDVETVRAALRPSTTPS